MKLHKIKVLNLVSGSSEQIQISSLPNECPSCHNKIRPEYSNGIVKSGGISSRESQLLFVCPVDLCRDLFIAYYQEYKPAQQNTRFNLKRLAPQKVDQVQFSEIIEGISPSFVKIYNQAHTAEVMELEEICGVGYRKASEFLIKDYLINLSPEDEKKIKKEPLGAVIKNRVDHSKLKEVAKRATWLGNDETHYERRWEEKDVKDLKLLINLTVRWIEMDKMTEEIMEDMKED